MTPDGEYRLREIIQRASNVRDTERAVLSTEDVDNALKSRNVESVCRFTCGDCRPFPRHYGAVQGLAALGSSVCYNSPETMPVVRLLILQISSHICKMPEMQLAD